MMKSAKIKLYIGRLDRDLKSKHILSSVETLERISREATLTGTALPGTGSRRWNCLASTGACSWSATRLAGREIL